MGTVSSDEAFKMLSKESKAYVQGKAEDFRLAYNALHDIRLELGLTQNEVADTLNISQKNVSSFESRSDMKLSTLKSYLHALGGELIISAKFPSKDACIIESLSD